MEEIIFATYEGRYVRWTPHDAGIASRERACSCTRGGGGYTSSCYIGRAVLYTHLKILGRGHFTLYSSLWCLGVVTSCYKRYVLVVTQREGMYN